MTLRWNLKDVVMIGEHEELILKHVVLNKNLKSRIYVRSVHEQVPGERNLKKLGS